MPEGPKLVSRLPSPTFHVVLVNPEIPPNTGAVARTCAATNAVLHLVGTLGFRVDERSVRRAGLDYWSSVTVHRHASLEAFETTNAGRRVHVFSGKARRSYLEADFETGDALVFGCESVGLPESVLERHAGRQWGIPTSGAVRSLNLSNAVAIVVYEALRSQGLIDAADLTD